jgi:alpha-galactosidase
MIENKNIKRTLLIDNEQHTISTYSFIHKPSEYELHRAPSADFSFHLNGEIISGISGDLNVTDSRITDQGVTTIKLIGDVGGNAKNLEITLHYQASDESTGIKKWFTVRNNRNEDILITDICVEHLNVDPWGGANSIIYGNFARDFYKPPFTGYHEDPAVFIEGLKGTIIAGNEAPGMTRFTSVFAKGSNELRIGMRPHDDPYAVNVRIGAGDIFKSPAAFILFSRPNNSPTENLARFVRNDLDVTFFKRKDYPAFFYNTWAPFRTNINEKMIQEIADALEGTGAGYLIIDDGWQNNYGDWEADPQKFPSGMKNIADYIRSKGMKPGIWFSLCSVEKSSKAFELHRDNTIKNPDGKPTNLHGWANDLTFFTMDILSPWYDFIKQKTIMMIEEHGFEYFKIDLSFIKSAYITDPLISGNYRKDEPASRHEFYYPAYQKLMQYFDELKAEYPEVIFDCTYELWGDHHAIDYALIQYADVDWISNFFDDPPEGSRDVRSLAWRQGNLIPTATMMIGNQQMDVNNHEFSFLSGFAGIPMMLGDPRNLSVDEKEWYSKMSGWFSRMQRKYNFMPFYQTEGFDKPGKYNWDGFTRINPETGGGIICVFRNESPDSERNILVRAISKEMKYNILDADRKLVGEFEGGELIKSGFPVSIPGQNMGMVFEIEVER